MQSPSVYGLDRRPVLAGQVAPGVGHRHRARAHVGGRLGHGADHAPGRRELDHVTVGHAELGEVIGVHVGVAGALPLAQRLHLAAAGVEHALETAAGEAVRVDGRVEAVELAVSTRLVADLTELVDHAVGRDVEVAVASGSAGATTDDSSGRRCPPSVARSSSHGTRMLRVGELQQLVGRRDRTPASTPPPGSSR